MQRRVPSELTRSGRFFSGFSLLIFVLIAGLVTLGFWQLARLEEKKALITAVAERFDAPPVMLSDFPVSDPAPLYQHVVVDGVAVGAPIKLAAKYHVNQHGNEWLQLVALENKRYVLVNLGWFPEHLMMAAMPKNTRLRARGNVVPWAKEPAFFLPQNQIEKDQFYWPVQPDIAMRLERSALPMADDYVQLSSCPFKAPLCDGKQWPLPVAYQPNLRNDHLEYALTWLGLAMVAFFSWVMWLFVQPRTSSADKPY